MNKYAQFRAFMESIVSDQTIVDGILHASRIIFESESENIADSMAKKITNLYNNGKRNDGIKELSDFRDMVLKAKKSNKTTSANDDFDILLKTFKKVTKDVAKDEGIYNQIEKDFISLAKSTDTPKDNQDDGDATSGSKEYGAKLRSSISKRGHDMRATNKNNKNKATYSNIIKDTGNDTEGTSGNSFSGTDSKSDTDSVETDNTIPKSKTIDKNDDIPTDKATQFSENYSRGNMLTGRNDYIGAGKAYLASVQNASSTKEKIMGLAALATVLGKTGNPNDIKKSRAVLDKILEISPNNKWAKNRMTEVEARFKEIADKMRQERSAEGRI